MTASRESGLNAEIGDRVRIRIGQPGEGYTFIVTAVGYSHSGVKLLWSGSFICNASGTEILKQCPRLACRSTQVDE